MPYKIVFNSFKQFDLKVMKIIVSRKGKIIWDKIQKFAVKYVTHQFMISWATSKLEDGKSWIGTGWTEAKKSFSSYFANTTT